MSDEQIDYWITDGPLDGLGGRAIGRKILGPFGSQDLAMKVRTYIEKVEGHERYWVCPEQIRDVIGAVR